MARIQKVICASCTGTIRVGESYCDHCGQPTTWASYEERIDWEVRQWRNARSRSGTSEVIQPRYTQSRGSGVAVAEMDAPPQRAATSVDPHGDTSSPDVLRESLFARLRRFARRLMDLFNARIETSSVDDAAAAAYEYDDELQPVGRPTLVIVNDAQTETTEPGVAAPEPVVAAPPEPVVVTAPTVPAEPAPARVEPEPVVAEPVAAAPTPVTPSQPVTPPAAATSAPLSPAVRRTPPRKRPNRPTNKELLQRALTTLERVEARLHHLEEEIEEIDQAVRKAPPAAPSEDDDLEPPAAGPFGYI